MRVFKKTFCLTLSLVMIGSILSGCAPQQNEVSSQPEIVTAEPSQEPVETAPQELTESEAEIQKAIELGFVPDALQGNYDQQMSYGEFCSMLDRYFETAAPDAMDSWKNSSVNYHDAQDEMTLMEGILVLFQAAQDSNIDSVGYRYTMPMPDGRWVDYPLLGDIEAIKYYDETIASDEQYAHILNHIYPNTAVSFVSRFSSGNGRTYFDFNDQNSFDYQSPLTREAAVKAVKRLYETTLFATFVPADEIVCGVSEEAMAAGAKLPAVSYDDLPDWHGICLSSSAMNLANGVGKYYDEEEIRLIAEQGFNMIRAQMDYRDVFPGKDTTRVCAEMVANMDTLVNWCAKYGLHLCFDLTDMPGFTTDMNDSNDDLFTNPETQNLFQNIWAFMAEHYKDVPSNLLSFLLLNEPHDADGGALTDENFSYVMRKAIDAIRDVSPDRLIITSTLGANFTGPAEGLADAKVAFGCSAYPLPDQAKQWPAYYISKNHGQGCGDLVLKGNFSAGTRVGLTVMQYSRCSLTLFADDQAVLAFDIDGQILDGTGLTMTQGDADIQWEGSNGGIYGMYTVTLELQDPCRELRLQNANDDYYELYTVNVFTPENGYTLNGATDFELEWQKNLILSLNADGSITSENSDGLVVRGKDALRELLQECLEYRERTGAEFLVLESGFQAGVPVEAAAKCAEDWFSVLEEYQIPWINYNNDFAPLMDSREADLRPLLSDSRNGEVTWYRQGSTYEKLSDRYVVDPVLMEVYQKHMNR